MATNPGALVVLVELGPETTEAEFHEMYENDHVPPRLAMPEFVGGYRLQAIDGEKPSWGGLFSVSDLGVINSPQVAALMAQRTERELRISGAYTALDRRAYKLIYDSVDDESARKSDVQPTIVLFVGITTSDPEELHAWYKEEHLTMLSATPGWARTRRYRFIGGGVAGPLLEGKVVPEFLSVVEFASEADLQSDEFKASISTPRRDEISKNVTLRERRVFKIFKTISK